MAHTAIRVLGDVSRLSVDDSLDEGLQVFILGQKLVQMGKLVTSIA